MNTHAQNQANRRRFDGLLQIARYNWPQYVGAAAVVLVASAWLWFVDPSSGWLRLGVWIAALLAAWWSIASLVASHWIYDVSELYRWTWIPSVLPARPRCWLNLHAGLDESSSTLRHLFPESEGQIGDFFEADEMSEPSIQRARIEQDRDGTARRVNHRHLPFPDQSFDAVFLLFAAHEIRRPTSREAFMREVRRVLTLSGTVLLVEHGRDLANFVAFGPGFLHFMQGSEWHRLAKIAGLEIVLEQRMTPFVKIVQLRSKS